jgi:hypothetical protein
LWHAGGMAGGMGGRRGIPLSRRVRVDEQTGGACPARHCWVAGGIDGGIDALSTAGVTRPGLLVEWRAGESGWEGRVVYAAQLRAGVWVLVEEWLPATLLTPR